MSSYDPDLNVFRVRLHGLTKYKVCLLWTKIKSGSMGTWLFCANQINDQIGRYRSFFLIETTISLINVFWYISNHWEITIRKCSEGEEKDGTN